MNISKFQYQNPLLSKLNFYINKDFNKDANNTSIENTIAVGVSRNDNGPNANVSLNVKIGGNSDELPFYIECEMMAGFSWEESAYDDETINSLLTINAPALLLSYVRPIVAQITNMSPFPSYNIPFFNFLPEKE